MNLYDVTACQRTRGKILDSVKDRKRKKYEVAFKKKKISRENTRTTAQLLSDRKIKKGTHIINI